MNLCDELTIRMLLERHGFHFSKSMGQNFLIDPEVELAPDPSFRAAMLARVPLAFAFHLDAALADPGDQVAFHQDGGGGAEDTPLAIEDTHVFKQDGCMKRLGGVHGTTGQEGAAQGATE